MSIARMDVLHTPHTSFVSSHPSSGCDLGHRQSIDDAYSQRDCYVLLHLPSLSLTATETTSCDVVLGVMQKHDIPGYAQISVRSA